jgi:hypothetical protein
VQYLVGGTNNLVVTTEAARAGHERQATGHADAPALARAVAEFAASGAPLSIEQVGELKVSLTGRAGPEPAPCRADRCWADGHACG